MKVSVMNAFTDGPGSGNPAGVAYMAKGSNLPEEKMQEIAAGLNLSETAFISRTGEKAFSVRYFTPVCEVPVCGHATIAAFSFLRREGEISDGVWQLLAGEETLSIRVSDGIVWMEMPEPTLGEPLDMAATNRLCHAFGTEPSELDRRVPPRIVTAGIRDIHLCVRSREILLRARQDETEVSAISKQYQAAGVHMSCLSEEQEITACCSNFAPACGIPEECATGTSNAGLTFYLYKLGLIQPNRENCFLQGEHMGRPSKVYSRISDEGGISVLIGGTAEEVCRRDVG